MKKLLVILAMIMMVSGVHAAVYFNIGPATGYSEPLSEGDVIEVTATTQSAQAGETVRDSWWLFYYNNVELGEVLTLKPAFTINGSYELVGSDPLTVGSYVMANRVHLRIWSGLATQNYYTNSNNYLEVQPTGPMTPSTSTWGLIILLLAVPAVILWRR